MVARRSGVERQLERHHFYSNAGSKRNHAGRTHRNARTSPKDDAMTQTRKRRPRDNATNPPYESSKIDLEFNVRTIKNYGAPKPAKNPAIKTIGVVGALFDKDYNIYS